MKAGKIWSRHKVIDFLLGIHGGRLLMQSFPGEMDTPDVNVSLDDMKSTLEFIRLLQNATLETSGLAPDVLERIRNPPEDSFEINEPDLELAIKLHLALANASDEAYHAIRDAIQQRFPDSEIPTLHKVWR